MRFLYKWFFFLSCFSVVFGQEAFEPEEKEPQEEIALSELKGVSSSIGLPSNAKISELPSLKRKSPFLAVTLSLLPGMGHLYLDENRTAGEIFGVFSSSLGASSIGMGRDDPVIAYSGSLIGVNTWLYGIYAAYRDVRIYNRQESYKYLMPIESFSELSYAPFNYQVLKKPEVWGGVLGALGAAYAVTYCMDLWQRKTAPASANVGFRTVSVLSAFAVGLGEESFFRGFLQPTLVESLTPWGGIAVSSLLFGAAHMPKGIVMTKQERKGYYTFIVPFLSAFGAYFGWLSYKNRSLKESTAIHAWYDFVLFLGETLAYSSISSEEGGSKESRFSVSFSF